MRTQPTSLRIPDELLDRAQALVFPLTGRAFWRRLSRHSVILMALAEGLDVLERRVVEQGTTEPGRASR